MRDPTTDPLSSVNHLGRRHDLLVTGHHEGLVHIGRGPQTRPLQRRGDGSFEHPRRIRHPLWDVAGMRDEDRDVGIRVIPIPDHTSVGSVLRGPFQQIAHLVEIGRDLRPVQREHVANRSRDRRKGRDRVPILVQIDERGSRRVRTPLVAPRSIHVQPRDHDHGDSIEQSAPVLRKITRDREHRVGTARLVPVNLSLKIDPPTASIKSMS